MTKQDVLVVREMFMFDGAYVQRGDVISDPEKMARCWAAHGSEKLIPTSHDVPDAPAPAPAAPAATPTPAAAAAPAASKPSEASAPPSDAAKAAPSA